jgi:Flp pilus assembly protein CpaB
MHHQTRDTLWASAAKVSGATGSLLKGQSRLRLGLITGIAVCLFLNYCPHPLAAIGNLWSGETTDMVPVLVVDHYTPAFKVIKPEDVRVRNYPKDFVPPGALHAKTELLMETDRYVYSSIVSLPEGEPLTRTILVDIGKDHGLSSFLHLGRVAVSFHVDNSRAAGGWIQPGNTIAIFATLPPDPRKGFALKKTQLLLNAVNVLAVDKAHVGEKPDPEEKTNTVTELTTVESDSHMITVLANPKEATDLIEARERGPLSVILRATGDDLPWAAAE